MYIPSSVFSVRPDKPDRRDYRFRADNLNDVRQQVDLRPWCSPVEDQLHLGSCVGQAIVGAFELTVNRLFPDRFIDLSRLFVYYNARLYEGGYYLNEDVGAYVRDGIKSVNKWGVCSELIWPYIIEKFAVAPSIHSYEDAQKRIIKKYYRVQTLEDMIYSLHLNYPVVISMNVYDSFYLLEDPALQILPLPKESENLIGGHAVTLVGYDLEKRLLLARNSFGKDWGVEGYFWVPFDYVGKDFMDCWIFDIEML